MMTASPTSPNGSPPIRLFRLIVTEATVASVDQKARPVRGKGFQRSYSNIEKPDPETGIRGLVFFHDFRS